MAEAPVYPASVIITTKNRRDELRNAIDSALAQSVTAEIVVFDDGSTDGTSAMVRQHYPHPQISLHRVEQSLGVNEARNQAIARARAPIVITIDDDCTFPTPRIIEATLADFDHPRIGAVSIPSIDVHTGPKVHLQPPDRHRVYVCSEFRGGANAMRRELFLELGSYRKFLYRQGEESDYCLRMLGAGYVVRVGRADPIHHFESPVRDRTRIIFYQVRNNHLYAWYNVPMPYMPFHLLMTTYNNLRSGFRAGYRMASVRGVAHGYGGIVHELPRRNPVSRQAYRLMRRLKGRPNTPLEDIEPLLPPMRPLGRCS